MKSSSYKPLYDKEFGYQYLNVQFKIDPYVLYHTVKYHTFFSFLAMISEIGGFTVVAYMLFYSIIGPMTSFFYKISVI